MTVKLTIAGFTAAAALLAGGVAQAGDWWDWEDIRAPYCQRIDTMTTSSGNAQAVNSVTHMITPWPPYAHNPRIPVDGARMVGAVKRYREPLGNGNANGDQQQPNVYNPTMSSTTTTDGKSSTTKTTGQDSYGKQAQQQ